MSNTVSLSVVSGETTELTIAVPGVQGPIGTNTFPSGGAAGQIIVKDTVANYDTSWTSTISGFTIQFPVISNPSLTGTLSGGTQSGVTLINSVIADTTCTGLTLSGGTHTDTIVSSGTVKGCDITGGTMSGVTITTATLSGNTFQAFATTSGTLTTPTVTGGTFDSPVITSGTITSGTITAPAVTSGTVTSGVLIDCTISGSIAAQAGGSMTIGGSSDSIGFFGETPVVQPTGISNVASTATLAETITALSGVIQALGDLGLIA